MSNADIIIEGFFLYAILLAVILLYRRLFRPWTEVQAELRRLERKLATLERGKWRARIETWVSEPWLKGDVEKHKQLLRSQIELKKKELEAFNTVRGGLE